MMPAGRARLALSQRQAAQVVAVERHVEGVELHLVVVPAWVQGVEVGDAVDAEHDRFAIDDELPVPVLERALDNARI
jgi:hypothetical protein